MQKWKPTSSNLSSASPADDLFALKTFGNTKTSLPPTPKPSLSPSLYTRCLKGYSISIIYRLPLLKFKDGKVWGNFVEQSRHCSWISGWRHIIQNICTCEICLTLFHTSSSASSMRKNFVGYSRSWLVWRRGKVYLVVLSLRATSPPETQHPVCDGTKEISKNIIRPFFIYCYMLKMVMSLAKQKSIQF
jgi:hypothetical protein